MTGRVQGVGYRQWAVGEARALGLSGWVRNRLDGSVEMLVAGAALAVEALIERARRGPPAARVETVITEDAIGITPEGFSAKPTL